jgi:metallo-beta-lactamase family protein
MESTYGDREHPHTPLIEQIRSSFAETFRRRGTVLIPAFAVARAQMVLLLLSRLMASGRLPQVPIHVDSPMAMDVTSLYRTYAGSEGLDIKKDDLYPQNVRFHRTTEDSRKLNSLSGPRIIISASGMLTGGRVLHHLERLLGRPQNLILLVGYQAAGTRGRSLLEGASTLRMHGRDIPVRAHVQHIDELSAHADVNGLVSWVQSAAETPRNVFVVHGEPMASRELARRLKSLVDNVEVPDLNSTYALTAAGRWSLARGGDAPPLRNTTRV